MGDLLFAIANLARKLGVEPESALRQANRSSASASKAGKALRGKGRSVHDATLEEMEAVWQRDQGRPLRAMPAFRQSTRLSHDAHDEHDEPPKAVASDAALWTVTAWFSRASRFAPWKRSILSASPILGAPYGLRGLRTTPHRLQLKLRASRTNRPQRRSASRNPGRSTGSSLVTALKVGPNPTSPHG